MKTISIILIILVGLFFVAQAFITRSTNNTEEHAYEVLKEYDSFEIRKYEPAVFSYTVMKSDSFGPSSSRGFRTLAGYIFGGNETNEKIAMTTPVTMTMDDSMTMKFMVPSDMEMEDLPKPNDPNVRFEQQPEKTVAAIRFSGWANDARIAKYTEKLKGLLDKEGIEHSGEFSFLGYNPPYEVVNRRNEVIVEVSL